MLRIFVPPLVIVAVALLARVACNSEPTPIAVPTLTPTPTATQAVPPAPTATPTLTPKPTLAAPSPSVGSPTPEPPFPWTSFGPGTWRVGEQIVPGVYETGQVSGQCEWARLSRFDDSGADVLFAETTSAAALVAVLPTDAGFRASDGCGLWTLRLSPTPTPTPTPILSISSQHITISGNWSHVCALRPDGSPVCWGDNEHGQAWPPRGERFAAISSGYDFTCALRPDGSPVCWGANPSILGDYGQASPPRGERFAAISSGYDHTCALRLDGSPVCWGYDGLYGVTSPPQNERFMAISSGDEFTCALRLDGSPVCWGYDGRALGLDLGSPPQEERFASISSGFLHVCALRPTALPFAGEAGQQTLPRGTNASPPSAAASTTTARCVLMVHPFAGGEVGLTMAKPRRLQTRGSPLGR